MLSLAVLVYWMQPCMSAVMWMHQTETLTGKQYNNVLGQLTIKCIFYCLVISFTIFLILMLLTYYIIVLLVQLIILTFIFCSLNDVTIKCNLFWHLSVKLIFNIFSAFGHFYYCYGLPFLMCYFLYLYKIVFLFSSYSTKWFNDFY
jgi:hypothetical protein